MTKERNRCGCVKNNHKGSCPGALERIRAMQFEAARKGDTLSVTEGNEWYVNSAEHGHCWSRFAQDLQGSPVADKEICQLLLITPQQLTEIYNSAIAKLMNLEDKTALLNMLELVEELSDVRNDDNTVYLPDSYQEAINASIAQNAEETAPPPPGKPGRKRADGSDARPNVKKAKKAFDALGQPVHISGKRIDLQFASPKSYQTIADSRDKLKTKQENIEAAKALREKLKNEGGE